MCDSSSSSSSRSAQDWDEQSGYADCSHSAGGVCHVSSMLIDMPVPLDRDACNVCLMQDIPMAPNRVTCSRAMWVLKHNGIPRPESLRKCVQPPPQGVGTQLENRIASIRSSRAFRWLRLGWLLEKKEGCGCDQLRDAMNAKGVAWCRLYSRDISKRLLWRLTRRAYRTRLGWLTRVGIVRAIVFDRARQEVLDAADRHEQWLSREQKCNG